MQAYILVVVLLCILEIRKINRMLSKIDHKTFQLKIDEHINLELRDVVGFVDAFKHKQIGSFKLLVDLEKGYLNLSEEAFSYIRTHPIFLELEKMAIILVTLPNRLLVRFWINNNKMSCPVEIFESYDEGVKWIKV